MSTSSDRKRHRSNSSSGPSSSRNSSTYDYDLDEPSTKKHNMIKASDIDDKYESDEEEEEDKIDEENESDQENGIDDDVGRKESMQVTEVFNKNEWIEHKRYKDKIKLTSTFWKWRNNNTEIEIYLRFGKHAIIDAKNKFVLDHKWRYHILISKGSMFESIITTLKHDVNKFGSKGLSTMIMKSKTGEIVDHKNGDRMNNLESNLCITDFTGNNRNHKLQYNNTSGLNGLTQVINESRWRARCYTSHGKDAVQSFCYGGTSRLTCSLAARLCYEWLQYMRNKVNSINGIRNKDGIYEDGKDFDFKKIKMILPTDKIVTKSNTGIRGVSLDERNHRFAACFEHFGKTFRKSFSFNSNSSSSRELAKGKAVQWRSDLEKTYLKPKFTIENLPSLSEILSNPKILRTYS